MSNVKISKQENYDSSRTMMDNIGEHCVECNQLDFLPFTCQICHKSYCSNHRLLYNEHACVKITKKVPSVDVTQLPTAKSLYPDREQHRLEQIKKLNNNSILGQLEQRSKDEDSIAKLALVKLKKFLKKNKKISLVPKKPSASSKIIELAKLKKLAVGDQKIPTSERIYINVQYIPSLEEIAKVKEKKMAIFVSRSWPIGRLLDQASLQLKIKNENNKTQDLEKKLTIFKHTETDPVYIPANSRVMKEIHDGDLIYVVRGAAII